jgi:hypothetical protein
MLFSPSGGHLFILSKDGSGRVLDLSASLAPRDLPGLEGGMSWRPAPDGKVSENEGRLPEGVSVTRGPAGMDDSELLLTGEVDAIFTAKEPQAYIDGDPKVVRLFRDYRETEREYFKTTGIFPIMHAVAIRKDTVEQNLKVLEAFLLYSYEQGLSERLLTVEELSHPSTMSLSDEG